MHLMCLMLLVVIFCTDLMNPSSILFWNVSGLNGKGRRDSVREVITFSGANVVCLQETKLENLNRFMLCSVFGFEFDKFVALPAVGKNLLF
jgi:hypothetical protein